MTAPIKLNKFPINIAPPPAPIAPIAPIKLNKFPIIIAPPPAQHNQQCIEALPITLSSIQAQLEVATQINRTMQQTIIDQNRDIARLTAEAKTLQNTIDSMNNQIASLRGELTAIPILQIQISALEESVANLRQILSQILAMI